MEPSYILHSRPYRNTSLILDLFTRNEGRISLLVKGARGKKTKGGGRLQPFEPLLISWFGRGELKTAKDIDYSGSSSALTGDKLIVGLYLNEMLYFLLGKQEAVPPVFDEYHLLVNQLGCGTFSESDLREFEMTLLNHLGYGLVFDTDLSTGKSIQADKHYVFAADEGFTEMGVQDESKVYYSGEKLLKISARDFSEIEILSLSKKLLRQAISFRLGGRNLKSRELFPGRK